MRLIGQFHNIQHGQLFSQYLSSLGIENQAEISVNRDWGSSEYGDKVCTIWVIDEDAFPKAMLLQEQFRQNPQDPIYTKTSTSASTTLLEPFMSDRTNSNSNRPEVISQPSIAPAVRQSLGPITLALLIICSILLFISEMTTPPMTAPIPPFPPTALYTSPIKQKLLYDYPYAYTLVNKLEALYGIARLRDPQELPPEGKKLTITAYDTPYWQGIYNELIIHWKQPNAPWDLHAPMFEKIRQGEIWRLWTPMLLHSDVIHLLFNMLWLLVLGKQMELKLGGFRYLLFILIAALFSNTSQYLMSGANFIGFSGVLCAMLTFVWMRQRKAAWEGYQLQRSTWIFMMIFILGMGAIQVVSFLFETFSNFTLTPGIANTAHLSGAAIGLAMGKMDYFAEKN